MMDEIYEKKKTDQNWIFECSFIEINYVLYISV